MNKNTMDHWFQKAQALDTADPLSSFRKKFIHGTKNLIYLDGNSLGRLPIATSDLIRKVIEDQWGERLIRSWNENWLGLSSKIAAKIANLIGASEDEVYVGDTTSTNLYKLAYAAAQHAPSKTKIITDNLNFPTDLYVLQGMISQHFPTHSITTVESRDGIRMEPGNLQKAVDNNTAFITLSYVTYKSAYLYDMARVNDLAHQHDSLVIWDLSHAAGAVPVNLHESGADMAVGCTYKYLNGGPGAPAFLYVKKELQDKLTNPIWAWFSHKEPFAFDPVYKAGPGIQRFASSTPSILSLAAIEPGIDLLLQAGMENIRQKSNHQSAFLLEMIKDVLLPLGFTLASPENANERGSHISIGHPDAYRINRAMIEPKKDTVQIIPDFRPPDNIRLGIAPLYNSFSDLYKCIFRIHQIVSEEEYKSFSKEKLTVT